MSTLPQAANRFLEDALATTRLENARHVNAVRLVGTSGFLLLFVILGARSHFPDGGGPLLPLEAYWVASLALFAVGFRHRRLIVLSTWALAVVDMPAVFWVQRSILGQSDVRGIAGFTIAIYVVLTLLSALSLRRSELWSTAVSAAAWGSALQLLENTGPGAIAATLLLLGITTAICAYGQSKLLQLLKKVASDLERRQLLQEKLVLTNRLTALGTLAAGVAHEINNPLSYVLVNLEVTERELQRGALSAAAATESLSATRDALEGARRVRQIIADLQTLVRAEAQRTGIDLRDLVRSAVNLARHEIRGRAQLSLELGPLPQVDGDESRLSQVFVNLLLHAAHAIPEGAVDHNWIKICTRTDEQGQAVVEFFDSGSAAPFKLRNRVLHPLFDAKWLGEGSGLGLTLCQSIVTAHGGQIKLQKGPGEPILFRVSLPPRVSENGERP